MKEKHNYIASSLWYKEKIQDPYQVFAELFAFADIAYYRKLIREILLFAYRDKVYSKADPGNVLADFKMLESAINAAYLVNRDKKKSPVTIEEHDLLKKNLYCDKPGMEWECFPRALSLKEYKDPYRVFKNFFRYQELHQWKECLQEVLECVLLKHTDQKELDLLSIYLHLTRLMEAAHLIDVRETTHIAGRIKARY